MTNDIGPTVAIANDNIIVTVAPATGGRIAQIAVRGIDLLIGHDDAPPPIESIAWGSYPMVPWAGRIRNGQFRLGRRVVDLPRTAGQHAMHGVGHASPWTVVSVDDTSIELQHELPSDLRWPFGGRSTQRISVDDGGLLLELDVRADGEAFPASIGWHPWFRKPSAFEFEPTAMYRRDATGITVDELVEVPSPPWDDCFLNQRPIRVEIDGLSTTLTSNCDHWVVYSERTYATCIEPQTGPPDAPNIRPVLLQPDTTLSAWFRITPDV